MALINGTTSNDTLNGSASADTLNGGAGNDIINGGGGNDVFDGGAGADTMTGGSGDDLYVVDNIGDVVNENASEGTDTVKSTISYTLGANLENLILTGGSGISGTGNALNNVITGNAGANLINGGAGADTMSGGGGNDTYVVDNAGDVVTELSNGGTDLVQASISYTLGANIEKLTLTGSDDINATGNTMANTLTGNAGNNTLSGGSGIDTMIGGAGDDTYIVDHVSDSVTEAANAGTDTVLASANYTLGNNIENLTLTGTSGLTGKGNTSNNVITGNSGNNTLDGRAGADTLIGGAGNDTYVVDNILDVVTENAGEGTDLVQSSASYTLSDNIENLTLATGNINGTGNALNNVLTGGSGANILNGGAGNDTMIGGTGNDTYIVDDAGDVVTEASNAGTDLVQASFSYTLGNNIENLTLASSAGDINATGNALANKLTGNAGANTLNGLAGADTMAGGDGDDLYIVDNASDVIIENVRQGTDSVQSSVSYTLGLNIENLTLTGTSAINANGNTIANLLTGNSGANILDGFAGADTLIGGAGNDTYVVDNALDEITELAGEGTDLVKASASYVLSEFLENLTLTGTASINGTGNASNNVILGTSGNNILDGMEGADTLTGGLGNDTYIIDSALDVITEAASAGTDTVKASISYTLSVNLENLTLTGSDDINGTGNASNNNMIGNDGANSITALAGNDTLDGGAGADTLTGGLGNDIYYVDDAGDVITEAAAEGTDTVNATITYTLDTNLENLTLKGADAIDGTGNTVNNVIIGNTNNNVIDGGAGADSMSGGAGDDTYVVDNIGDVVTEIASAGTDLVQSSVTYTLGLNLENLTLTGVAAINGTGNAVGNVITGNDGNNSLSGLAGNDTLDGGLGADTLIGGLGDDLFIVDDAGDVVTEAAASGTDLVEASVTHTLAANVENLTLTGSDNIDGTGNTMANIIIGNDGNNIIDGGAGADSMSGGNGDDTYIIDSALDVITENAGEGTDLVEAGFTYTLGADLENLTLTGVGNFNGTGNELDNVITGNTGNNIIDGLVGADSMIGGAGDDTYIVDDAGDVITEAAGEGTDLVQAGFTYTLADDLENLTLTGSDAIDGTGNAVNNVILGNANNNVIDGLAGADSMSGGAGDDTYVVDDAGDVVTEAAAEGTDLVQSSVTYVLGSNLENLTLTGSDNIDGTGNTIANVILGNDGNNILDGGVGADSMSGGNGDDTYIVDDAGDEITENSGEGTDLVQTSLTYTLGADLENLTLTGAGHVDGTGNELDNVILGNAGNNVLDGLVGADSMEGGAGNDTYVVDDAGDVVSENASEGTDLVQASVSFTLGTDIENLTLTGSDDIDGTGNELDNVILGNAGNNIIDGQAGADSMTGGAGDDTYIVDDAGDSVTEALNAGTDSVQADITYTLGSNLENLTLTGTNAIDGTGNSLDNVITGNDNDNVLNGGTGVDTLIGGLGDDTYQIDGLTDVITENSGEGTDTVEVSFSYTLAADLENLTLTGTGGISGTGNELDNVITGNSGNNIIDGGLGADTMIGGDGGDTYTVDDAGDVVVEEENEGVDTVRSSISYALNIDLENLILTGSDNIDATGSNVDNSITGNDGDNIIDGGAGADTMAGGAGDDTYVVDDEGDIVTEATASGTDNVQSSVNFVLGAHIENLALTGTANIDGTGNGTANSITGNDGDNVLDGAAGADTLTGGLGDDTYVIDNAGDVVVENSGEGFDLVQSNVSYTLGADVENLTLTASGGISGTGNELDNVITGNSGDNQIDGGIGEDTLIGGDGGDTYIVDDAGDIVIENSGEGTDLVKSSVDYLLVSDVENLTLTGTDNINGTGNTLDNVIIGNAGNNILDGGTGADTLTGGAGDDTYVVDDAGDLVTEGVGAGTDLVQANVSYILGSNLENLTLTGNDAIDGTGNGVANIIIGNDANNVIDAGGGADHLTGGLGADTFVFQSASAYGAIDTITDFSTAEGDALNLHDLLSAYDAMTTNITDFIQITDDGSDSAVMIDRDGTGSTYGWTQVATVTGVTGLNDVVVLIGNGTIIV